MNRALDEVVAGLPNATVCDLRTFVLGEDDLMSDIRHYRRHVYLRMAEEIRAAGAGQLVVTPDSRASQAYRALRRFGARRRLEAEKLVRRLRAQGPGRPS